MASGTERCSILVPGARIVIEFLSVYGPNLDLLQSVRTERVGRHPQRRADRAITVLVEVALQTCLGSCGILANQ